MKRCNIFSWLPLNSKNNIYLGISDLCFADGGIDGKIMGGFLGRVALVWGLSSVLNYQKDRLLFTLVGVRPLWLILATIYNHFIEIMAFGIDDKEIVKLYALVFQETTDIAKTGTDFFYGFILAKYMSCLQIVALEFKIVGSFSFQLYIVDVLIELSKLFFGYKKNVLIKC